MLLNVNGTVFTVDEEGNRTMTLESKLVEFEIAVRALVRRHETLASSENEHYWSLLDELHYLLTKVEV